MLVIDWWNVGDILVHLLLFSAAAIGLYSIISENWYNGDEKDLSPGEVFLENYEKAERRREYNAYLAARKEQR